MTVSFKYWNDCCDAVDIEAMWMDTEVNAEWISAGETRGQKVHLSRDPDGEPYLTQTEMRAVAAIIIQRFFDSQIDLDMICAIAELESDRQLLAERYDKKLKDSTLGIMQIFPKTADWLARDMNYRAFEVEGDPDILFRPLVNVYIGAAYIKWLANYENKERGEEFIVRAYKGGIKKATHKSTLSYWKRYLSVKESLPSRKVYEFAPASSKPNVPSQASAQTAAGGFYWDAKVSPEDLTDMWNHPNVTEEWRKSGRKKGEVHFNLDKAKKPYLSRKELQAVAEIILFKHFSTRVVKPEALCALAEIVSSRHLNGSGSRIGLLGIDFQLALWLYKDLGYKAYKVESADDLTNPFASMYFGAAYMAWLSEYEGRQRPPEFVVQAYLTNPRDVKPNETGPLWLKFEQTMSHYGHSKREHGSCYIL